MKNNPNIKDKRYKDGADAGVMSNLNIPLPVKPIETSKNDKPPMSMGDKLRLKGLEKRNKKEANEIRRIINNKMELVTSILKDKGYDVVKRK
jgi:hypothetical protein